MKETAEPALSFRLRDVLYYILLRWRSVLAGALAAAVLVGGYGYLRDHMAYRSQSRQGQTDASARMAEVRHYRSAHESACRYTEEALLMRIDPRAVPTRQISYLITGSHAGAVAAVYEKYLAAEDLYTDLTGKSAGGDIALPAYLAELVTTEVEYDQAAAPAADPVPVLLSVQIVAPTEELCLQLGEVVTECVTALTGRIREDVGDFTCSPVYDAYAVLHSEALSQKQQSHLQERNTLETQLAQAEGMLTAEELAQVDAEETARQSGMSPPTISARAVLFGFLLGGGLLVLWYTLRYVTEGRLQSPVDMSVRHGMAVFGVASSSVHHRFPDRLIRRLLAPASEGLPLLLQQVALTAQQAQKRSVYLVTCPLTQEEREQLEGLEEALHAKGITLYNAGSPLRDATAMERLAAADCLLLVERLGASRHTEIARLLELAGRLDRQILGAVLLQ